MFLFLNLFFIILTYPMSLLLFFLAFSWAAFYYSKFSLSVNLAVSYRLGSFSSLLAVTDYNKQPRTYQDLKLLVTSTLFLSKDLTWFTLFTVSMPLLLTPHTRYYAFRSPTTFPLIYAFPSLWASNWNHFPSIWRTLLGFPSVRICWYWQIPLIFFLKIFPLHFFFQGCIS